MKALYLLVVLISGNCVAQQSYTLQQALEIALANNKQVKQAELQSQAAAINLSQAKSNLLPDISASINHGLNQGRSIDPFSNSYVNQNVNYANYSLNSGIILFSGLIQRNLIRQNLLSFEASKMDQQKAKDELTLNVMYAYFQILNNEDQLAQADLQAEVTRKQVDRTKFLNREGAIAPSLLFDLMGQLSNDELSLINSRNSLSASKIALAQLMNVPYDRDFKVQRLAPDLIQKNPDDPDKVYALALEQLALVKASVFRKESAQKAIQVARGGRSPQLSLSGDLYSNYSSAAMSSRLVSSQNFATDEYVEFNGSKLPVFTPQRTFDNSKIAYNNQIRNNYSSSVSLGLRIPIFNSLTTRNQVSLAKIELKNAELEEETIRVQLKQAVDLAWINMKSAAERLKTLNSQLSSYKESFRAAEARFTAGAGTIVDYTIAKNNLDRTNINLINAKYDYILRTRILDYYRGSLSF